MMAATETERALMDRDGISPADARAILAELRELVAKGELTPDEALDDLGFEPDYVFDLLGPF
jgi:hypothetical protein